MALPERLQVEAVRRYRRRLGLISAGASAVALAAFAGLETYDEDLVDEFDEATAAPLAAAKTQAVALAAGFYALTATRRPPAVAADDVAVTMAVRDPFVAVWSALSNGDQWSDAMLAGLSRADAEGERLVVSSARQTGDAMPDTARIVGWRRVLSTPSCDWCQLVSTQRYRTAESADFGHERCDCTVVPIYGTTDPGRVVNRALLDELNRSGASADLNDARNRARHRQRAALAERQIPRLPVEQRARAAERLAVWAQAA